MNHWNMKIKRLKFFPQECMQVKEREREKSLFNRCDECVMMMMEAAMHNRCMYLLLTGGSCAL
jgi:hypothetical protein